jgi:hypothetical protein
LSCRVHSGSSVHAGENVALFLLLDTAATEIDGVAPSFSDETDFECSEIEEEEEMAGVVVVVPRRR